MTRPAPALAALLSLAACSSGLPAMPMPTGLAPASAADAAAWAASTLPDANRDVRFRWQFRDDRSAAGGRGRARLAVPDSLRLDVSGPVSCCRGAAFVRGDSSVWAAPEEDVRRLVPNFPLFWAMLGIARAPAAGATVRRFADGTLTAWQFAADGDTVEYVRLGGANPRLIAEVRQQGRPVGRVETRFGPDGFPASARLVAPSAPARLDLTFYQNSRAGAFAADTWTPPPAVP